MVDFNNESTVSTPPGDVVKIVILERREQVIEALEAYYRVKDADFNPDAQEGVLRSRVISFFLELQSMLKRRKPEEYEEVRAAVFSKKKPEELREVFEWLNDFIDEMGLTLIDNKRNYDGMTFEEANKYDGI